MLFGKTPKNLFRRTKQLGEIKKMTVCSFANAQKWTLVLFCGLLLAPGIHANNQNNPCRSATSSEDPKTANILRLLEAQEAQRKRETQKKRKAKKDEDSNKRKKKKLTEQQQQASLLKRIEKASAKISQKPKNWNTRTYSETTMGNLTFALKTVITIKRNYVEIEGEKIFTADPPGIHFLPVHVIVKNSEVKNRSGSNGKITAIESTRINRNSIDAERVLDLQLSVSEVDGLFELTVSLDGKPLWEGNYNFAADNIVGIF